jgi:hypothetical protein
MGIISFILFWVIWIIPTFFIILYPFATLSEGSTEEVKKFENIQLVFNFTIIINILINSILSIYGRGSHIYPIIHAGLALLLTGYRAGLN